MQVGEAQLELRRRARFGVFGPRAHQLIAVQHLRDNRRRAVPTFPCGLDGRQLKLLGLDHSGLLGVNQRPAQYLGEMVVVADFDLR